MPLNSFIDTDTFYWRITTREAKETTHFHPIGILQSTPLWWSEHIFLLIKYLNHLDSSIIIALPLCMNSMSWVRSPCRRHASLYESRNSHWDHGRFSFVPRISVLSLAQLFLTVFRYYASPWKFGGSFSFQAHYEIGSRRGRRGRHKKEMFKH